MFFTKQMESKRKKYDFDNQGKNLKNWEPTTSWGWFLKKYIVLTMLRLSWWYNYNQDETRFWFQTFTSWNKKENKKFLVLESLSKVNNKAIVS